MRRKLEELFMERNEASPHQAARQFLTDVREHAALLLERGPGEYGFIHLTFEEYLAAVALALMGQGNAAPIIETLSAHVGEQAWREVTLLTIGYLGISQQLPKVAGEVVEALVNNQPGPPTAKRWYWLVMPFWIPGLVASLQSKNMLFKHC
ncbi:MAG: hypothetical protein IPN96_15870 [Anaerolineales bacterium]|nr:hypothetical protein [Anaerolineales bacterium]